MATTISKKRKVCTLHAQKWQQQGTLPFILFSDGTAAAQGGTEPSCLCAAQTQFVADGVFYAELNELLTRELAEHGYSGVEVRVTPMRTEIIIRATRTQNVLGEGC